MTTSPSHMISTRVLLTPSMICRYFIALLARQFEPGTFIQRYPQESTLIDGIMQREIRWEIGNLEMSLDDYGEYMMPHVLAMAALMRMAKAYQIFNLAMPSHVYGCRHQFDGLSVRLIRDSEQFVAGVAFLPHHHSYFEDLNPLIDRLLEVDA
jgi:hypothetical protein